MRAALVWLAIAAVAGGCGSSASRGAGAAASGLDGAGAGSAAAEEAAQSAGTASDAAVADAGAGAPAITSRRAVAIGVGDHVSCALLDGGEVRCWGATRLTATPQSSVPIAVGIDDAVSLAVGVMHVCVARRDGSVWCWGDNRDGQLGDGSETPRGEPAPVAGASGIVEVAAGRHHTCARDGKGDVWCWGHSGTVGHPRLRAARKPGKVLGVARATRLVAGDDLTCAFVDGGTPRCWGFNTTTLLGRALGPVQRAVRSESLVRAVALAIGYRHACLTQEDGLVYCAGNDHFGQLGDQPVPDDAQCDPYDRRGVVCRWTDPPPPRDDDDRCSPCPHRPSNLPPPPPPERHEKVFADRNGFVLAAGVRAVALGAGDGRTCAITPAADIASQEVRCWGQWYYANDWAFRRPRTIAGTRGALAIAVAQEHACALLADGAVRCWGYNRAGELGTGAVIPETRATPDAHPVPFP